MPCDWYLGWGVSVIYALKINDSYTFCDTTERFAASFGPVTEKNAFHTCLEEYLQDGEGRCSLPRQTDPWEFYKGSSQEEIEQGKGELIVTLHEGSKEALWDLVKWVNGPCTMLQIKVDY